MTKRGLQLTSIMVVAAAVAAAFILRTPATVQAQEQQQTMPEVIVLGKDAKLGTVTFPHAKHNSGEYSIVPGQAITCTQCHHTARPAADLAKYPPLKTAWPADRTTTLTLDLFKADPKAAGVAACRDCHVKEGTKPKLLDAIPQVKQESTTAVLNLTNMTTFHRNCAGCHAEARKANPAYKGPTATECMKCHKKAAA